MTDLIIGILTMYTYGQHVRNKEFKKLNKIHCVLYLLKYIMVKAHKNIIKNFECPPCK